MAIVRREEGERGLSRGRFDPWQMMQDMMRWDPFHELTQGVAPSGLEFVPTFDVKETKDAYVFKADLPGIREEDLDISLTGNRLTVSGQRAEEKKDEGDRYFAYERNYGSFSRSFTLPEGIDLEHVQADLKDGVLTVALPKRPEVQPKRIQLMGGKGDKEKAKAKA